MVGVLRSSVGVTSVGARRRVGALPHASRNQTGRYFALFAANSHPSDKSEGRMTHKGRGAELFLIVGSADGAAARLAAALESAHVSTVLLTEGDATKLAPLVVLAQRSGVATLVDDDAGLAKTVGADGVHLGWSPDIASRYSEARDILGAHAIVGTDAGQSRHDAMVLGEAGADYVAFSAATEAGEASEALADMLAWWSDLFEVPCVAFGVRGVTEADEMVTAGADFVAVRVGDTADAAAIRDLVERLDAVLDRGVQAGESAA